MVQLDSGTREQRDILRASKEALGERAERHLMSEQRRKVHSHGAQRKARLLEHGFTVHFYAKINTELLLYLYQIFIFPLGHLHFFLHFFFTFMENLFKKRPIYPLIIEEE